MTKSKKKTTSSSVKEGVNVAKSKTFINSKGVKLTLYGVPPLLIPRIAESISYPEKPTYTVSLATGDVEVHEYDDESITTPEEKVAWEKYKKEYQESEEKLTNMILKAMLAEAVEIKASKEELDKWVRKQKYIGLPVPEDDEEIYNLYKESRAIGDAEDIQEIMTIVFELTGISEEELQLARASFPDRMESKS